MNDAIGLGGFCFSVLGAAVVAWGIWRAWTRPTEDDPTMPAAPPAAPPAARWSIGGEIKRLFIVEGVSDYVAGTPAHAPVMSREIERAARTEGTNGRTNERSSHQIEWDTFLLDRTRARLISVMVDSDLTTTEIRALLKGESKAIGDEVDAARLRLGKAAPDQYRTPIAGRPTSAAYREQDPELEYQAPPV